MKRGRGFALLGSVLLVTLFLNGCGSSSSSSSSTEPTGNDPALVGTWLLSISNGPLPRGSSLTFTATTWTMAVFRTCTMSGTYITADGELTIEVTGNNDCGQQPGSKERMRYTATATTLVLDGEDNSHTEWSRQ